MIQPNDLVNGAFELGGGLLLWGNVRRLWRDREVRGVYWPAMAFFALWGLWNLFYYPSLSQWCSFFGGVVIVAANVTWVAMAVHFTRRRA